MSEWNATCLSVRERVCDIYSDLTIGDYSRDLQCGCTHPVDQSLNNCIMPLPTYFIKLAYPEFTNYTTPKALIIENCVFQHFFYSVNAIVDIPNVPSYVLITHTQFDKIST